MARYTMGEVKIDGIYPVDEVMELAMDIGVNHHGLLTYGGHVSKDDAKRYIQQNAEGQAVSISLRGELEFCGQVQTIIAEERNDYWYVKSRSSQAATLWTSTRMTVSFKMPNVLIRAS